MFADKDLLSTTSSCTGMYSQTTMFGLWLKGVSGHINNKRTMTQLEKKGSPILTCCCLLRKLFNINEFVIKDGKSVF